MNHARSPQTRALRLVGLFAFLPFLLTGCLKFTMDLEVSPQDTISGVAVVALSNELGGFTEGAEGGSPFADTDGVTESEFDDGSFVGTQYEFSDVPIEQLSLDDDSSELRIQRDGDNLVVSGSLSFEDEQSGGSTGDDFGFGQAVFDSADIRISIKFPGEIRETNGEIDEASNTITWYPEFGEPNELSAVVYSPKGLPLWVWWAAGGGAVALGLVFLALRWVRSRRVKPIRGVTEGLGFGVDREAQEEALKEPTIGSNQDEAPSAPPIETGTPIFSYRVRTSFFPPEWFEVKVQADEILFAFFRGSSESSTSWERIPVTAITSVTELSDGFGVRVVHAGQVDVIPAKKSDARALVGLIESLGQGSGRSPDSTQAPRQSLADYLREIAQLRDEGLISEAEFDELKKRRIQAE